MAPKGPMSFVADGFIVKPTSVSNKIVSSGRLAANEQVNIQPEVNGKITQIFFTEGKAVNKGATLVKLDDADLLAQINKVQTQRQLSVNTEERQKKLLDINGISKQEYDLTTTQIRSFDADLAILRTQLEKTEIKAPFSGVIGLRNISIGAVVTSGTILTVLQQLNPLKLEFSVPEKYANDLKTGQKIKCAFPGMKDTLIGTIYVINPIIDAATGTIMAKAKIDNSGNKLSPGQFANVEILLNSKPQAILIPSQSVIPGTRFKQVATYKNGVVQMKEVVTGERNESEVEILQGLEFGDTVLTTGIMQARDQGKVQLKQIINAASANTNN
ncbi:MAG: efflux RND transporter periplasmic adaptor subunit [Sphingobacteriales bacterium]|nr:efflux RND transporter periplasmic adaptor subunit [Sphingobacteriales bacterium]